MMTIKIDKGVPMPAAKRGRGSRSYLWQMEVGDSVFLPGVKEFGGRVNSQRKAGWKFTARTVSEDGKTGIRVWRTA